jgi:rod shape-determining protein MreB
MLVALDVGSYQTRVAVAGKGEVLCEPTLVANCWSLPQSVAVGQVAVPILERAPERVQVFQPVSQAHLASPGAVREQLRQMLKKQLRIWARPVARLVLPSVASPLERKQWAELLKDLGFLRTHIVQMPVAIAWGSTTAEPAVAVVDIGATTTEMALVAADVVLRRSIRWGGNDLEAALQRCLYQEHGLEVSRATARSVKHQLSCWQEHWREDTVEVRGRQLSSGLPIYQDVSQASLGQALMEPLQRLVELVRSVLDQMPPLLAEAVLQQGLTLSGGGSYLQGLDVYLKEQVDLPVQRSPRPIECAVTGALRVPTELAMEP